MTIPEILKELEFYTRRFPVEALQAAVAQREAITPELLGFIEKAAADPVKFAAQQDCMLPVFAIYLLAFFREKRAYPAIVKMVSGPGDTPSDLIGDTVAEGLHRIFASVYDGDPGPLQRLAANEKADEFVRGAAINAFVVLGHSGQMPREDVVRHLQSFFRGGLQREPHEVWNALVCAAADLPAPELLEDVRQAYRDDLADEYYADLEGIEQNIMGSGSPYRLENPLIGDPVAEMEGWACFHDEDKFPNVAFPAAAIENLPPEPDFIPPPPPPPPRPARSTKIGRNEPCPCELAFAWAALESVKKAGDDVRSL
jgi:hypothetical protein